jgi:transposase InsO family protein
MPWKEICPMEQRVAFVQAALRRELTMTALCEAYGISRKTGYQVLGQYRAAGEPGLAPRSRAPHRSPQALPPATRQRILALRQAHPSWGPRKLRAWLQARHTGVAWPAPSTMGALLQRAGLTRPARPRRAQGPGRRTALTQASAPNDVWTIDFKGWFVTGDGRRCDPLTLVDEASRYLLCCVAVRRPTEPEVQRWLERAFREYGLPQVIRSDNGAPFGLARGLVQLSRLAVWWLKLAIRPERIAPGHPEQNPRHERLHRTLKAETASPPAPTRCAQQRAFDRFRPLYNHERPHEALNQRPPGHVYRPSPRPYPARVVSPEYPDALHVRRVRADGYLKWQGRLIFLSHALRGEPVGLEEVADGCWRISFGSLPLGCLHADADRLHPLLG